MMNGWARRWTRRLAVTVISGALLVPFGMVDMARAHSFTEASNIDINYRSGKFHGSVGSDRVRCQRRRTVRLYKARRGPDTLKATDRTNRWGNYGFRRPNAHGRFYVEVEGRTSSRYGHFHRCRGDRSPTIRVRR
jgi:hypothetical protein